ncbi:MAG: DnaJ C-terminal domain-containing protein [Vampirovibrionales bacterium]|nr:DnaJ C-terminal domain-containing protein [Vampirovibrionales bacterium]
MPDSPPKNYYQALELANFADLEQVKSAFRRLAREYHPDLNAGSKDKEERFKQINEAYETLGVADKKAHYDQTLKIRLKIVTGSSKPEPAASPRATESSKPAPEKNRPNPKEAGVSSGSDFFDKVRKAFANQEKVNEKVGASFFKSTGTKFSGHQKTNRSPAPKRGQDVSVEAMITYQEAQEGVIKTVNVQQQDICRRCSGTGKVTGKGCPLCHGEKYLIRHKKIDVKIPAGVKSGSKVRVAAEGAKGENGADAGDLFLLIKVEAAPKSASGSNSHNTYKGSDPARSPDEFRQSLRVEGLDVYGELPVSIPQAVLGATLSVPTLYAQVELTIPPLTSSGRVLRLKEQGVSSGNEKGDYYITLRIVSPDGLTDREKELYQELLRLNNTRNQ